MDSGRIIAQLDRVCLQPNAKSLSLPIHAGELIAVTGATASGKSHLLETLAGEASPASGKISKPKETHFCGDPVFPRRATPLSLAKASLPRGDSQRAVIVLNALQLTDLRDEPVARLTPGQMIAASLISCLVPEIGLSIIDGHLDLLDPWTLEGVMNLIHDDQETGKAFVISSNQPSLVEQCDQVVILRNEEAIFAGSIGELLTAAAPAELIIDCADPSAVQAMVDPFILSAKQSPGTLTITTHKGQAVAAQLLTHGYGAVKLVVLKEPTVKEALLTF